MPTIVFTLCIANAFRIYTPVHVTLCSEGLEAEEIGKNIVRTELGKQRFIFFVLVWRTVLESYVVMPKIICACNYVCVLKVL